MAKGKPLRRKLDKKVIRKLGQDVIKKRYEGAEQLSIYGEPEGGIWSLVESTIRIVIITDKREVEETLIGGLPQDNNKEMLLFYFSGNDDVKTGDKIVYPVGTEDEWIVFGLEPIIFDDINVISKAKCHRDARY